MKKTFSSVVFNQEMNRKRINNFELTKVSSSFSNSIHKKYLKKRISKKNIYDFRNNTKFYFENSSFMIKINKMKKYFQSQISSKTQMVAPRLKNKLQTYLNSHSEYKNQSINHYLLSKNTKNQIISQSRVQIQRKLRNNLIIFYKFFENKTIKEIAKKFRLSLTKIYQIIKNFKDNYPLFIKENKININCCSLYLQIENYINFLIKNQSSLLNCKILKKKLEENLGIEFDKNFNFYKLIKNMKLKFKKISMPFTINSENKFSIFNFMNCFWNKIISNHEMLFFDVSTIIRSQNNLRSWGFSGQPISINYSTKYPKIHILGIISFSKIYSIQIIYGSVTSKIIYSFLKDSFQMLIKKNEPSRKFALIMDNASVNRNRYTKILLKNLNVNIIYLPKKMPVLNIIENFWRDIKNKFLPEFIDENEKIYQNIYKAILEIKNKNFQSYQSEFFTYCINFLEYLENEQKEIHKIE